MSMFNVYSSWKACQQTTNFHKSKDKWKEWVHIHHTTPHHTIHESQSFYYLIVLQHVVRLDVRVVSRASQATS